MKKQTPALLSITNVSYAYGDNQVLKGIDLELNQGEVLGVIGPNGSGKSTLLSLLVEILPLQAGHISFENEKISSLGHRWRSKFGVVFQRAALDNKLSVKQNLMLAARMYGITGKQAQKRVEDLLEADGLTAKADKAVGTLSGGQRRRIDIARAIIHQPSILVMDEPTVGLDETSFRKTWTRLNHLVKREKLTILLTTHRPEEAAQCSRLAIIHQGKIIDNAAPEDLQKKVGNDMIVIETKKADEIQQTLAGDLGYSAILDHEKVLVECEEGHMLIPRLVEALPSKEIISISLRRPSLADVFLKITGTSLDGFDKEELAA